MQFNNLDILFTLNSLIESVKEIEKLSLLLLDKWPMYAANMLKCTEIDGSVCCQSQNLKQFESAKYYFASNHKAYCGKVNNYMKCMIMCSNTQLLHDIILVLSTWDWQKLLDENDDIDAIDRLVRHFSLPLAKAGACLKDTYS